MEYKEFTIEWLIASSVIGSVITLLVKYVFDEQITYYVRNKRKTRTIIKKYTKPLLNYGYSLERRVNNFIKNYEKKWLNTSEYYELTTMFLFAQYFSQIYIIQTELGYVEYNKYDLTHKTNLTIRNIFSSLSSHKILKSTSPKVEDGGVLKRFVITAIGECATIQEDKVRRPMSFIEFQESYRNMGMKDVWFQFLFDFLQNAMNKKDNSIFFDRLIFFGKEVHELNLLLDEKRIIVRNSNPSNMNKMSSKFIEK